MSDNRTHLIGPSLYPHLTKGFTPLEIEMAVSALDIQTGGSHYKDQAIQPIQYIHANKLGYCEANIVKYATRWKQKNGIEDLKKIKHYVDLLIELEGLDANT